MTRVGVAIACDRGSDLAHGCWTCRWKSRSEGAARATGTVAIIGVLRAFTTAALALANAASAIVMVRSVEENVGITRRGDR